jgi:hypothetical protein
LLEYTRCPAWSASAFQAVFEDIHYDEVEKPDAGQSQQIHSESFGNPGMRRRMKEN